MRVRLVLRRSTQANICTAMSCELCAATAVGAYVTYDNVVVYIPTYVDVCAILLCVHTQRSTTSSSIFIWIAPRNETRDSCSATLIHLL